MSANLSEVKVLNITFRVRINTKQNVKTSFIAQLLSIIIDLLRNKIGQKAFPPREAANFTQA